MKQINTSNIDTYIKQTYGQITSHNFKKIPMIKGFLQNNFSGELDCGLVSLLTVLNYFEPLKDPNQIYNEIKAIAKKYLYSDNGGTYSCLYSSIVKSVFKKYNFSTSNIYFKRFKGLTWNIDNIKKNIDKKRPVLLDIHKDGNGYYKSHIVVVEAYYDYLINDKTHIYMLQIRDNFTNRTVYVDYQKLDTFSAITTV